MIDLKQVSKQLTDLYQGVCLDTNKIHETVFAQDSTANDFITFLDECANLTDDTLYVQTITVNKQLDGTYKLSVIGGLDNMTYGSNKKENPNEALMKILSIPMNDNYDELESLYRAVDIITKIEQHQVQLYTTAMPPVGANPILTAPPITAETAPPWTNSVLAKYASKIEEKYLKPLLK